MPSVVETASPHLRVSAAKASSAAATEAPSARITPPETSSVEDHFFWTYTEEPHRSRRQAIIKAHPEVCRYLSGSFETPNPWLGVFQPAVTEVATLFPWYLATVPEPQLLTSIFDF